jgi:prepilin signal peptidase PulO-like enzyme (type II secretory pathway)
MNEYLELKPDYSIILKSSLLTFLLYWFGVPFYVLYSIILFFVFINVEKKSYPILYTNVMNVVFIVCGIGILFKLAGLSNHKLKNVDEFRLVFD